MSYSSPQSENVSRDIIIREENGIPVEIACPLPLPKISTTESWRRNTTADITQLNSVDVKFSYEFAILDPKESIEEVIEQDLPSLEYGILYLVAKSTGLLQCDLKNQNINLWATDVMTVISNPEPYLVGLSNDIDDAWSSGAGTFHDTNT
jgi:hypothetical protein